MHWSNFIKKSESKVYYNNEGPINSSREQLRQVIAAKGGSSLSVLYI